MKSFYWVEEDIGKTGILRLWEIERYFGVKQRLFAKAEFQNPSGSVKDRAAFAMLKSLFCSESNIEGMVVAEPTSGNLGIYMAMLSSVMGFRAVIVMPSSYSLERRQIISAYGGEVVLVDGGMDEALRRCKEMIEFKQADFSLSQFDNPIGIDVHFRTTAPEIFYALYGAVSAVVVGVGSGATLSGIGRYFKKVSPKTRIVATEPFESNVLSGGVAKKHGISGLGAGFVPKNFDITVCDRIISVSTDRAIEVTNIIAKKEGILVGVSSGATLAAALEYRKECEEGENIVVIFADRGDRYISEGLYKQ